jgi:hypothetical protein
MLTGMGMRTRAWLIPASSDQSRTAAVPPQLLEAWTATVREWDWQSPATRERNVGVIQRHYRVDREVVAVLPRALALDWCRAGRPEPSGWIEAKLESILSAGRHRSVA